MDSDGCNIISAVVNSTANGSSLTAGIIICIVLILIRAFFTCCETACTEISDGKVKSFENEKGGKAALQAPFSPKRAYLRFLRTPHT